MQPISCFALACFTHGYTAGILQVKHGRCDIHEWCVHQITSITQEVTLLDSPHGLKGLLGGWVASSCPSLVNIVVSDQGTCSPSYLASSGRRCDSPLEEAVVGPPALTGLCILTITFAEFSVEAPNRLEVRCEGTVPVSDTRWVQ